MFGKITLLTPARPTATHRSVPPVLPLRPFLRVALFFLLPFLTCADDITLQVSPSRQNIYLGESFNLTVEVNGADRNLDAPDFPSQPAADIQFLGQRSNSRRNITIINGRITRESFEGRIFSFQLKPRAQGTFNTGPIRVAASGKVITHPGVTVQVAGVEKQSTVIAGVASSSTTVLVEEPFTITLSVAVAELPPPFCDNNEPLHPKLLPQLSADFLEIRQNTPGLKSPDLNQILNGLVDQTGNKPAFAINDYQTRDMGGFGSLFDADPFRPRPIRFRLVPKRVTIDGNNYREYSLALTYTPTKEGEFTFGPLSFKGPVVTDVTADRQAVTKDIYTIGPAVTVRVVPPPDQGRPECFIGTVGKTMEVTAAFDTTVCKVGDPLTLTLDITGDLSLANMRTPILNLQTNLTQNFRIYDENATADTLPNGKRFKYRIRPTREGTLEFPAIRLAYYNTESHSYTTVQTAPVPIQARATTQIATANDDTSTTGVLEAQNRPLPSGITLAPQGAHPATLLPSGRAPLILLTAAPALCLSAFLAPALITLCRSLRNRRRRTGALHRAQKRLSHTKSPALVSRTVREYLADRLDVIGRSLTPGETAELLRTRGIQQDTIERCRALLAQLEDALYRPGSTAASPELTANLLSLLSDIDQALSKKPITDND